MKVTLYMATSLDGFIATTEGETPWSQPTWNAYYALVKEKKNIIVGRKTYDLMVKADGEFKKCGNPFLAVLSESRAGSPDGHTMFAKSPEEALAVMKGQGFTDVLLGGGGTVNGAFLEADLIDEIILDIESVLLGNGIALFRNSTKQTKLQFMNITNLAPQVGRVHVRVKK